MSAAPLPSDLPNVLSGYRRLLDVLTAKAAEYAAEVNKLANSSHLSTECRVIQFKYTLLLGESLRNVQSSSALFAKRFNTDGATAGMPAEFRDAHRAVYDMLVGLSHIPKICRLTKVNEQIGALVVAAAAAAGVAAVAAVAAVGGRRRAPAPRARKALRGAGAACSGMRDSAVKYEEDTKKIKEDFDRVRAAFGLAPIKEVTDDELLEELAAMEAADAAVAEPTSAAAPASAPAAVPVAGGTARGRGRKPAAAASAKAPARRRATPKEIR